MENYCERDEERRPRWVAFVFCRSTKLKNTRKHENGPKSRLGRGTAVVGQDSPKLHLSTPCALFFCLKITITGCIQQTYVLGEEGYGKLHDVRIPDSQCGRLVFGGVGRRTVLYVAFTEGRGRSPEGVTKKAKDPEIG